LAVETASKLTYIKHNLILEHPDLFKTDRHKTETAEDEAPNEIIDDEIIIMEDC
jgi:hypothetical protein